MKNFGFTLIELVLVIALLGIVSVSLLYYGTAPNAARLNAAAQQVLNHIELAKQNAIMTGVTSGVNFTAASTYTVYQSSTATPLTDPLTRENLSTIQLSSTYPGVEIQGDYTVEFNSMGSPSTGGGSSVTLTQGVLTKTIAVTANTGKVAIQ